ncbi:glycosyltransferase [Sulfitobacter sp. HNIBRBA3233]|uniref:glycosyltransferase n=1 Tax=Sulfitobacter marinivivus TaxID=3158558 RepID=UPI0032DE9D3F
MSLPLPLLTEETAAVLLGDLWDRHHRSIPDPEGRAPTLLLSLPPAWGNRYQVLLYGRAAHHNTVVAGVRHPQDLAHVSWPGPVLLHAHWFASIFTSALSEADARARLDRTIAQIEAFATRTGARLLWTAHNLFPHDGAFPDTYLALRRWVFDRFDLLHVMDADHVPLLEQTYDRPAPPWFCVPHMTYHGAVPDSIDRLAARQQLGLPRDAFVFGAFGSLQGYKNTDRLMESFSALAATCPESSVALLAGGLPADREVARALARDAAAHPQITLLPRLIEDSEIQMMHRACDVMMLPYRGTLNSGAALMAATFGRPFVMPQGPGAAAMVPLGGRLYDPEAADGLHRVMAECLQDGPALAGPDRDALAARAPHEVSEAFFAALFGRGTPG